MHESPSPARSSTCGQVRGSLGALPTLAEQGSSLLPGLRGGGTGGRFETSILILVFFFCPWPRGPEAWLPPVPRAKYQPASQPGSLAPPIAHYPTQPFNIIAYLGTLALLAIGLPGCVIRAARIHLLASSCLADWPTDQPTG